VTLCVGDDRLIARITRRSAGAMGPFTGQTCHAMIRSVAVAPEDVGTGRQS
jgi:molybdate transport system ATP-binding protein